MNFKKISIRSTMAALILFSCLPTYRAQEMGFPTAFPNTAMRFSAFSVPQNMGAAINSSAMDQAPAPAPSGLSLYFTSNRTAGGFGGNDIWVSKRNTLTSAWGTAQNVGATINTSSNDTVTNISRDGLEMFITSNRGGNPDLYISTRTDPDDDFAWTTPVSLGPVVNSSFQDVNGVYFQDPRSGEGTLYFWSDRAEMGLGDIYESSRNPDGSFNPPANVTVFNSPASERGIAISSDGLESFVSSTRLGSPTTFTIFVSTRHSTRAPWRELVAVEGGINSSGSNSSQSLSHDDAILYFASNRTGGFGVGDIYSTIRVPVRPGHCR